MRLSLAVLLLAVPATSLVAQVGFLPKQSPYTEIANGTYLEATGGRVFGSGGPLLVGARDGTSEGLRFVLRGKNTLQFDFGFWSAGTKRSVIDADDSIAVRNKGLVGQRSIAGEIGIHLNLTGGKTWHRLAPYTGISFGLVHGSASPAADTSGYQFGTKLFFAPAIGTRLFLGQRVYLKLDARALFWKLVYPASYSDEPTKQPGTATQSNAVNTTGSPSQYVASPEIRLGLGIAW